MQPLDITMLVFIVCVVVVTAIVFYKFNKNDEK